MSTRHVLGGLTALAVALVVWVVGSPSADRTGGDHGGHAHPHPHGDHAHASGMSGLPPLRYAPPPPSEIEDLVVSGRPLGSTPTATWERLRWRAVPAGFEADAGGARVEPPAVVLPQTGPLTAEEAADPYKVYNPPADPRTVTRPEDPFKVYNGSELHPDDPFKVYDDPQVVRGPATHQGPRGPADSEREGHAGGARLSMGTPGKTVAEPHQDGRRMLRARSLTESDEGALLREDLTRGPLARLYPPDEVFQATLQPPAPVPTWPGPGTDTRAGR